MEKIYSQCYLRDIIKLFYTYFLPKLRCETKEKVRFPADRYTLHYNKLTNFFKFLSIVTGGDLSLDPSTVSLPFCQSNRKEELIKSNSKKCKIFNVHRTKTNFNSDSVDLKIQETKTEKYKWWCLYKALK